MTRRQYRKYKNTLSAWALILLVTLIAGVVHIDTVCSVRAAEISKQQIDTLDQIMTLRQEVDATPDHIGDVNNMIATDLTASDFDLVCRVVAAESRGEGYEGQLAVAQCIRDRAQLWGMTPAEVVTAPGQFASPYQGEIGPDVQAAVNDCLVLGKSAFDGAVTHFAEISITPYWAEGKEVAGVIGNHRFYR